MCFSKATDQEEKRRSKTDIRIKQVDFAHIAENPTQKGTKFSEGLTVK